MKIRVNKNDTDVGSIKSGECFWYKGLLYMRIFGVANSLGDIPIVLLSTGSYAELGPDTQVEKADCMVISAVDKCCENTEKGKWEV